MDDNPSVLLLATGGTIANPIDVDGYLSGRELLDDIPGIEDIADIEVRDVASTGSSGIGFDDWWNLLQEVSDATSRPEPPDGIVVTHGSNTVEETAYFLNLTVDTEIPVVLTASQRQHGVVGNDGDRNLIDAIRVAVDREARGRGALVVVADEIHSARDVTKVVSSRPNAWSSGNLGVLGSVDKDANVLFFRRTEQRHAPDTEFDVLAMDPSDFPRVDVVYAGVEMDGRMVSSAIENGAAGIVLAALPTGTPSKAGQEARARRAHTNGTPVVISHRGTEGWPYRGETFIWGNTLRPQKARILLALALTQTDDYEELQRMFTEY